MLKFKTIVIALFALGGAVGAVATIPSLLDFLFEFVKSTSTAPKSQNQSSIQIERKAYRRLDFPSEALARKAWDDVREKRSTFDELCSSRSAKCEDVQFSRNALTRAELEPLLKLTRPGDVVVVDEDIDQPGASLFEYRALLKAPLQGSSDETPNGYPGSRQPLILMALALMGAMFGGGLGNLVVKTSERGAERWGQMETGDRVNLFLGTVVGIIGSLPFLIAFGNLGPAVASLLTLGLTLGFSALSVYALNSMEEVLPWKKGEIRGRRSGIKVLDTNVLIDGRIYDLVRTGFLEGEIYVPKFVLKELQHIADSADALRRQRGRRGLEVLKHLSAEHPVEVGTHDRFASDESEDVDSRLVRLAMALGADLVSNDYNLNRVAGIQDVRVLNINDLALSLRPTILPGEVLELQIIREGSQQGQGVGYLDDGTMIVVENGREHIGETIDVTVTQVIQTERGKLIFGSYGGNEFRRSNTNRR